MRDSVVRLPDGTIGLRLVERERTILRALLGDLSEIVGEAADPPGMTPFDGEGDDERADDAERTGDAERADDQDPDAAASPVAFIDPVLVRLYPDARPDDPAWSGRFRDMIRGDLDDARRANLAVVSDTLDARSIDDDQAEAWLHVLNDLRLVMGTRLGVTDERDEQPFDPDDPDAAALVVYAYTGWLEGQFVDILASALPELPEADDEPAGEPPADEFAGDDS